jgi:cell division protein FtsX
VKIYLLHNSKFSCEITAFISGNSVLYYFKTEFSKINKITNKTNKMTKIFAFLLVLYVILLIFFVNSLFKTTEHTVASNESSDFTCFDYFMNQYPIKHPATILSSPQSALMLLCNLWKRFALVVFIFLSLIKSGICFGHIKNKTVRRTKNNNQHEIKYKHITGV